MQEQSDGKGRWGGRGKRPRRWVSCVGVGKGYMVCIAAAQKTRGRHSTSCEQGAEIGVMGVAGRAWNRWWTGALRPAGGWWWRKS